MKADGEVYVQVIPLMDKAVEIIQQHLNSLDLSGPGKAMGDSLMSGFRAATANFEKEMSITSNSLVGSIQKVLDTAGLKHFVPR